MDEIQPTDRDQFADEQQVAPPEQPMGDPMAMDGGMPGANEDPAADPNSEANTRKRQEQALMFEKYLEESGLSLSF